MWTSLMGTGMPVEYLRTRARGSRGRARPMGLHDVEAKQRPARCAHVLSIYDMAFLHAQTEHARARPGSKDLAESGRDLLRVLDEVRGPAMPTPRPRDLDLTATAKVEPPRARREDDQRPIDVVDPRDDAQRAAAAATRETQHAQRAGQETSGRRRHEHAQHRVQKAQQRVGRAVVFDSGHRLILHVAACLSPGIVSTASGAITRPREQTWPIRPTKQSPGRVSRRSTRAISRSSTRSPPRTRSGTIPPPRTPPRGPRGPRR